MAPARRSRSPRTVVDHFPGAKAALHTAAQLDPEDPLPRMCLAFALAELQLDREGAEQELLKAVEHNSEFVVA